MLNFFNLSIKYKLMINSMFASLLISGFILIVYPQQQESAYLKTNEDKLLNIKNMLSVNLALGIENQDFTGIIEAFDLARRDSNIKSIHVLDPFGGIFNGYNTEFSDSLNIEIYDHDTLLVFNEYMLINSLMYVDDRDVGSVQILYSLENLYDQLESDTQETTLIIILIILIAAAFSMLISLKLSGQVIDMEHALIGFQKNRDMQFNKTYNDDELGNLHTAMLDMMNELKEAEHKISLNLADRETLLKEIHHRVKNNLQIVSSLFYMQARSVKDPEALNILKTGQGRIKSMALIHEHLYQASNLQTIVFKDYINNLSRFLLMSYKVQDNIEMKVEVADDIHLNIDTIIPLGLMINEIITNSIKYAFDIDSKGIINIGCRKIGDERFELTVGDNGNGIPEGIDFKKSKSLGMKLVNDLTRQLSGNLSWNSDNGAQFIIEFSPLSPSLSND